MDYNWSVIDNEHMARMIEADVALKGNNAFCDALMLEAARRIRGMSEHLAEIDAETEREFTGSPYVTPVW